MAKSRTANTFYNFITSMFGEFLAIILQFVVRTVFIHTLGKSYLGINGLFSNILQMLSLAELGVGSAILFKLYEPLSKNDKKRITILLKFYKRVYQIIGIVITVLGLSLIPFLRYIVKDYNSLESLGINAVLIYLLFLIKTVSSYFFFAYKSAIVKADQKAYKLNLVNYIVTTITSFLQIIVLVFVQSFEVYVGVSIFTTILQNYLNARVAKKMYPYIDDKYEEKLDKKEMKDVFKDCSALLIYKINGVVLKATDNIIISKFLGLGMVGLYSNYFILYSTIDTILGKVFESVLHSLGNLHTTEDKKHEYNIFKTVNFIAIILGATAGIGIACVADEFVSTWIGKKWLLAQPFAILMGFEIYGLATRQYLSKYRSAMGLFKQAKYRPIFGMIINLVVSLLLVKNYGICGVLVGTIVADWTTIMWYDPLIIHKYGFKNQFSIKKYYLKNFINVIICLITGIGCLFMCNHLFINMGWISVIIHAILVSIIVPGIYLLCFYKTDEENELKKIINKFIKRRKIIKSN
ncbi:MAG: oligosaccharide flippase family protein [Bacilli bacterium]|nr:oligosaccharide flippase family protein [Bacilli bacterium]